MYRTMVFVKKTGTTVGQTYIGCDKRNTLNTDDSANTNPYFWYGSLPLDRWILLVGYIYPNSMSKTDIDSFISKTPYAYGVAIDLSNNSIINSIKFKVFKNGENATQSQRCYLYYCTDTTVRQYFWLPTFEEVNGTEVNIGKGLKDISISSKMQYDVTLSDIDNIKL